MSLKKYRLYIDLLRLNRPIGIWLLLWPCFCGLAIAEGTIADYFLFLLGTIALRSSGCVINDMADAKFDAHVKRSKNRPLAANTVKKIEAILIITICLMIGLWVWWQLAFKSQILSLAGALMMVIYPFLKRITYWPQIFLGFTFNIGFLIALLHKNIDINNTHLLIYAALIFWTLLYDTIYAFADITDDLKIGVKSSAIKMRKHPKLWLTIINLFIMLLLIVGHHHQLIIYSAFVGFVYLQIIIYFWNFKSDENCIATFKKCHFWGLGFWLILELIRIITP